MGILKKIVDFFKSLMNPSNEDPEIRHALKKLESELRLIAPDLYKNGLIQVYFAESLRQLHESTKKIADILTDTVCSSDLDCSRHYTEQLILTGFDASGQKILEELSYEKRKEGAKEAESMTRYFDSERKQLDILENQMAQPEFIKIDSVIDRVHQLNDISKFSFVTALRVFDSSYSSQPHYEPEFQTIPADLLEKSLEDLYYVLSDMEITNSLFNAVNALNKLKHGENTASEQEAELKANFKKIQGICKKILTKEVLTCLIRIAKKNGDFVPDRGVYKNESLKKFVENLETRFRADQVRLQGEIQDETITEEVKKLFGAGPMAQVYGYNNDLNNQLVQSTPCSFLWITPLQILKNFTSEYLNPYVKPLMNDIVIEGLFNNTQYKTDFSTVVFACNDLSERISNFENKFKRGNDFDEANIVGLIHDSHKDPAFAGTLKDLIDKINRYTKDFVQKEVSNLFALYKLLSEIVIESRKASSDTISNLKMLVISSRNKESAEKLEAQYPQWKVFFEVMKNYVIISTKEKK